MESLHYRFEGRECAVLRREHALVGVVASGNLEVLVEHVALDGAMEIGITTAARGFAATWCALLEDFAARHPLRDIRISINDVGATPAVVGLRLAQALEALQEEAQ
jgi:malonate decarboxylase delta subunit